MALPTNRKPRGQLQLHWRRTQTRSLNSTHQYRALPGVLGKGIASILQECIAAAQQSGESRGPGDLLPLAWMAWSFVHGIAKLAISGNVFSVLMLLAGIAAIAMPPIAGLAVNIVVAWLLLFSGAMHLFFAWYTRTAGAAVWEVLLGLVYATIGIYLLAQPVAGLAALTLALAIYLFLEAVLEFAA